MKRLLLFLLAFLASGLAPAAEPTEGRKFALLVGVQKYDGTGLNNLKYAEKDMADLKAALEKLGYKVTLVTRAEFKRTDKDDLDPTAENIRDHLAAITRNRKPEDTVLVAFSGHGAHLKTTDKLYYCPSRANLEKPETLVAIDDVMKALEPFDKTKQTGCNADHKVLLMDACRNDPTDGKGEDSKLASKTRPLIPDPPGGTVALFSCSKGQLSQESDKFKRGFLMHFVIDGLEGKAANAKTKQISWDKLVAHVKEEVPAAVVEEKGPKINQLPESLGRANVLSLGSLIASAANKEDETIEEFEWKGEKRKRTVRTLSLGGEKMEFVKIPAGSFKMGSPESDKDANANEKPQHTVTFTKPLWIAKHPVTKGQFGAFMKATGSKTEAESDGKGGWGYDSKELKSSPKFIWKNSGWDQTEQDPVVNVAWNDAIKFNEWASKESKKTIRLLNESEYEYANRGGTDTIYIGGDKSGDLEGYANVSDKSAKAKFDSFTAAPFDDGYVFTSPVGQFKPNGFGLYDTTGNVWSWCADVYDSKLYERGAVTDPKANAGSDQKYRTLRGGSWVNGPKSCRAACRHDGRDPRFRNNCIGFRVVLD